MNTAIILSGGNGSRAGGDIPKQYTYLGSNMMVTYALRPFLFCEYIDAIYIAASDEWRDEIMQDIRSLDNHISKPIEFVAPGAIRQLSILNALEKIAASLSDDELRRSSVIIHDGARPYLKESLVSKIYAAFDGHDGVAPALPVTDTLYTSKDSKVLSGRLNRNEIFALQSPELFRLEPYYNALKALLPDKIMQITGSCEPAVTSGLDIALIDGDPINRKITSAEDLVNWLNPRI